MIYIYYNLFITSFFLLYVELSVGNVIYRITSDGSRKILFSNVLSYLLEPLHNKFLWYKDLLDLNYIFILIISNIIYMGYKRYHSNNEPALSFKRWICNFAKNNATKNKTMPTIQADFLVFIHVCSFFCRRYAWDISIFYILYSSFYY